MKNIKRLQNSIFNIAIISFLLLFAFSCQDEEEEQLFEGNVTERLSNREQELKSALLEAENGWKMLYFTDAAKYGGFTILMDFKADNTVTMTSDIATGTADVMTSEYEIKLGNTVKLSFVTKNHIHRLQDNVNPGALYGTGYQGSGEFYYYGRDGEDIVFKSVRDVEAEKIIFTKATKKDWNEIVADNLAIAQHLEQGPDDSVFTNLIITKDNKQTIYPYEFNSLLRYVTMSGMNSEEVIIDKSFGVVYTPEGLNLYPALELDGVVMDSFQYDEQEDQFVYTSGGVTAVLGFSDQPASVSDDVYDIGKIFDGFGYNPGWGSNPLTSPGYYQLVDQVNTNLATATEYTFEGRVELYTVPNDEGYVTLYANISGFWGAFNFTSKIEDNKYYLEYVGPGNGNGSFFEPFVGPLLNFFGSSEGLYYTSEGSFKSSGSNYSNSACTFTSAESPNIRLYGLWF
ncbi:DUF4302 domain-containing protein [Galbibacter sp. PAP.153]|uniref:DUF4302 domain-containing protein n=1 Tax=Galbibacter sp. PAP.153 TaxID=3104623 RepID=UPI0030095232